MNIEDTLAPNSDQLDAVDLLGGPRTFTIEKVTKNNAEQPINVHLTEFPRVWRPGKSMRRVLAAAWGVDASKWAGRKLTLFCDPAVKFGGAAVGGTRISHMSHLDRPLTVPLLVTRGKSETFKVQPLPADTPTTQASDDRAALFAGLKDIGLTEKDQILTYVSDVTGATITTSKDLTDAQVTQVLAAIDADRKAQT